ncbi:enoyl-CoA hydratase/isomerase family protein [Sporichthya polymorpha]|uniref:enoyl-CoA hydratase/isomerase family protein n=1 Tax=Sporichthya polymorpha TaxID=35751 RepID=UPI00037D3D04|nr:enoyl-CoA hydratase/isomerase family protein [Sporichthya polymorpha]
MGDVAVVELDGVGLRLVPTGADAAPDEVAVADPPAEAARIEAAVDANPHAAALLVSVLRRTLDLDVRTALELESLAYSTLLGGPEFATWLFRRGPRPVPPLVADPVRLTRDGDVLHVTLTRPERRNAYGAQVRDALVDALAVALADPDVHVVLDGAGPCFCAGGDLDEFGTTPDPVTAHLIRTQAGAAWPLHQLAPRVEARLHGPCIGAGIELPAFAGRVVAAPGTTFRLPELGMGLIPGAGGTVSLPRRIGVARTAYLVLSGAPLDLDTALAWGLVDALGGDDIST